MSIDVVGKIETNLSALDGLLGKENVEDIKKRISDLIVKRVEDDLRHYDMYLFYPGDYKTCIDEAFEKVDKKITKMYADSMLDTAQEAVKRFKDISIASFNDTPGLQLRNCHRCANCDGNRCKFYVDQKYYWRAHDTICAEEKFINFIIKEK